MGKIIKGIDYDMASRHVVALSLFLVLVGAAMAQAEPIISKYQPISDFDYGEVQFVGKLVVDKYNEKGESHLYFIEVVNGTVVTLQQPYNGFYDVILSIIWALEVKANNCSQPGAAPGLYNAVAFQNMSPAGEYTEAYGSYFTADGDISPISN